jgi:RimJ/RimL family protein N-acetyltransferase/predicted GNAT family acetyltransferase
VSADERIRAFRRALEERTAERVVATAHGTGFLIDSAPDVYDENYLSVERPADAAELAAEADALLEAHRHRRIVVEAGAVGLTSELRAFGYVYSPHLVLAHAREPDRVADVSSIREVPLDRTLRARTAATLRESWGSEGLADQLNRVTARVAAAVPTRFFAAFAGDDIAGYCELREADGVAQIENVEILEEFRGRGLGRALVYHALAEARTRNEVMWLEALADDWPRELYAKLGFDLVGRRDVYTKAQHPLAPLRLRTPRVELRLATVAELRALYRVAEAGIHDPAFMPFGVAWTDELEQDGFLSFHAAQLATWRPDDWHLELIAFHDGMPIGSQGINGEHFAERRTVVTGSWLGQAWQRRGLGTEMRCAVLTLAFGRLGAVEARSGAIVGNEASLAISRKLGYRVVGTHTVSPRGEPVEHFDLELLPADFRSPVPVEIEGLDPSLFGV